MTPVFFLSNPEDTSLPSIKTELESIVLLLESHPLKEKINIQWRSNINIKTFSSIVRNYDHRIVLFHFAGHANSKELLFSDQAASAIGISEFFKKQPYLHLVVLNGCSTAEQIRQLLSNDVPAVIATSRAVPDKDASTFSEIFYQEWINNKQSLSDAFQSSSNHLKLSEAEVNVLIVRGTGLSTFEDDSSAWNLYINGNYPWVQDSKFLDVISNPLVGLPPVKEEWRSSAKVIDHFKGLAPFENSDASVFFGRNREIKRLYDFIQDKGQSSILLLYGQSGVGKSSLINAGLLPRLPSSTKIKVIQNDFVKALIVEENSGLETAVIIFDQVEKILKSNGNDLTTLLTFLKTNQSKVILSFRKEFLAEFSDHLKSERIPCQELFIKAFSPTQLEEVIISMDRLPIRGRDYYFADAEELASAIAAQLRDPKSSIATILQLLLSTMHKEAMPGSDNLKRMDVALLDRIGKRGQHLRVFLDYELELLKKHPNEFICNAGKTGLALDLLHTLIDREYFAAKEKVQEDLLAAYSHQNDLLLKLIDHLEDRFLLLKRTHHFIIGHHKETKKYVRLSHDTLSREVYSFYESSNLPGPISQRILTNKMKLWEQGTLLNKKELLLINNGLSGRKNLSQAEQELITRSQDIVQQSKRNRIITYGVIGSLLLVGAIAWWGFIQPQITAATLGNIEKNIQDREWAKVLVDYKKLNKGRTVRKHYLQMLLRAPLNSSVSTIRELGHLLQTFPSFSSETLQAKLVIAYWLSYSEDWQEGIEELGPLQDLSSLPQTRNNLRSAIYDQLEPTIRSTLAQHFPTFVEITNSGNSVPIDSCTGQSLLPFSISQYEITKAQFLVYLNLAEVFAAKSVTDLGDKEKLKLDTVRQIWHADTVDHQLPVEVRFDEAQAYCKWGGYQLASTQQWEWLARAIFPNDSVIKDPGRFQEIIDRDHAAAVGSSTANGYQVYDLLGNVSEWVISCDRQNSAELRGESYRTISVEQAYKNLFSHRFPFPGMSLGIGMRPIRDEN